MSTDKYDGRKPEPVYLTNQDTTAGDVLNALVAELSKRLDAMIKNAGKPDKCRGCGKDIFWIRHVNLRWTPYTAEGLNHFIDCPKRDEFRRRFHDHG